jgi:hypothetical protein
VTEILGEHRRLVEIVEGIQPVYELAEPMLKAPEAGALVVRN